MNASEYEKVTSEIAQSVFKRAEGFPSQNVLLGNASKWKGQSGFVHQIDVVIQGNNDLIMVECKCWKNKVVKAEHLLTFIARVNDIQPLLEKTIHPVMVTSHRFQNGCHKLAKCYGVDLEIISSPAEFAFQY